MASKTDHFRAHLRTPVDLPVAMTGERARGGRRGRLVDLGLGGAQVELERSAESPPPELDDALLLEIEAPTLWDPLSLRGRVAWVRSLPSTKVRFGVRFEHREEGGLFGLSRLLSPTLPVEP